MSLKVRLKDIEEIHVLIKGGFRDNPCVVILQAYVVELCAIIHIRSFFYLQQEIPLRDPKVSPISIDLNDRQLCPFVTSTINNMWKFYLEWLNPSSGAFSNCGVIKNKGMQHVFINQIDVEI